MKSAARTSLICLLLIGACSCVCADPQGKLLLNQVQTAALAVRSVTGECTGSSTDPSSATGMTYIKGKFEFLRPNYLREDDWLSPKPNVVMLGPASKHTVYACDGKTTWDIDQEGNLKKTQSAKLSDSSNSAIYLFIDPEGFLKFDSMIQGHEEFSRAPDASWQGLPCKVLLISGSIGDSNQTLAARIYIGPNNLVRGLEAKFGPLSVVSMVFTKIRLNAQLTPAGFVFKSPTFVTNVQSSGQNKTPDDPTNGVVIDSKSKAILERSVQATATLKGLTADYGTLLTVTATGRKPHMTLWSGSVKLLKPNLVWYKYQPIEYVAKTKTWKHYPGAVEVDVADGKKTLSYWDPVSKYYESHPEPANADEVHISFGEDLQAFFSTKASFYGELGNGANEGRQIDLHYLGPREFRGVRCDVVGGRSWGDGETVTYLILVGPDRLIRRLDRRAVLDNGGIVENDFSISHIDTHPRLSKADFVFNLPKGATQKVQFDFSNLPKASAQPSNAGPLANGVAAPDFAVGASNSKAVHLSDYNGHVVVLDFWATWCGPCQELLPGTEAIAKKYKDKGVVFLAVNVWDTKSAFNSWFPAHMNLADLHFATDPTADNKDVAPVLYNVTGIPTQFVIDPGENIVTSIVGVDTSSSDLENAIKSVLPK